MTGQPVQLRLIGPVQLAEQGRVLDVGPPQRQAVLAALAADAGTPVPVELLVDRVWGERPPDRARTALYAHVSRLRRVLARLAAPVRLDRRNGAYLLGIDRDRVDLHRFHRLLDQAKNPRCADDRRVLLLREALANWCGEPMAGVPGTWAAGLRRGTEPVLIGAAALWAQAELRLGHAAAVIDRLSDLIGRYPLAEPLVAAFMRALSAVGRQVEALQCYATTRDRLREELGAEPGSDLRDLHLAILRAGPDRPPTASVATTVRPAWPVPDPTQRPIPRQLPSLGAGFAGRVRELTAIEAAFAAAAYGGEAAVVAINGRGGVGCSALAIRAAHRVADRFPDGQLYVNLRGGGAGGQRERLIPVLHRFLRTLGVSLPARTGGIEEAAGMYHLATAGRRLLVVVDNARAAVDVRPLLPADPGCGAIVTSRRALVGLDGATHLHLEPLSEPEALDMLRQLLGARRVAAEPDAVAEVARWCGYLPLALRAAAARFAARPRWPLAELARRLADDRRRLDVLDLTELSMRHCLAGSFRDLSASADAKDHAAAAVFTRLARYDRDDLSSSDAAVHLCLPVTEAEALLERLVDARLLDSPAPGRFRMPHLLRLYALEQPHPVTDPAR
ncbi:AfsR/SARP family transcriptional regulator [Rhizomonospora bruguierae]|uniref:AfsR/SARP family transcriptional regulator n=1 Tax=Rhizomonospora bruguierae TaxID=1581705 RepID=UPI001BCDE562|nr:AfsR/SARP family transcriptional regulator [Micromonospora sp. NBRC 107566]